MAKILQFPSRDPYADLTEQETSQLLRASLAVSLRRTTPKVNTGTDAPTFTPQGAD